jgi:hypothetical protein
MIQMGLDFSPGEAHWSYGSFHDFRKRLAREIGLELEEMRGFGGSKQWEEVRDPIKHLLFHSDCEGILTVSECMVVYPRLIELVSNWDEENYHKKEAIILADDMKYCADKKIPLEFC